MEMGEGPSEQFKNKDGIIRMFLSILETYFGDKIM